MKAVSIFVFLAASILVAQAPLFDRLKITFDTPVRVGSQTIPAGEYTIRQLGTQSNPRLLEFSTERGTVMQTAVTAVPIIDNNDRTDTSVILKRDGGQYYLHRIWVKGKTYGYEIPNDGQGTSAVAQSRELKINATYTPMRTEVARVEPAAPVNPEPAPAPVEVAAAPAQAPAPAPVEAAPVQAAAPAVVVEEAPPTTPQMPKTASDWPLFVLGGATMLAAGMFLKAHNRAR